MNEEKFDTIEEFLTGEKAPVDPVVAEEGDGIETDPQDPAGEPDITDPVDPATGEDGEGKDGKGKGKPAPKTTPANNPMRALRDKANAATREREKIDGAVHRLSDGEYKFKLRDFKNDEGKIDYDALIEAMDEADVEQRAAGKGIDPKLQAEIEKYEREKREVEIAKARVQMDRQLNNFQIENQMSQEDLNNFISDSMKMGVNPLTIASLDKTAKGTTALKMLHQAVYADKIIKIAVDEAVAKVRAEYDDKAVAAGGQPKTNPAAPSKGKTDTTDPKGMALDEFLGTL